MAGLIPFNRRNSNLARAGTGFEDFYNMIDDFFNDGLMPAGRNLLRDSFKLDIVEKDGEYLIEAEMPGVKKEEIDLNIDGDNLCISVNRTEEVNNDGKNFIHRERRASSMSRRVRLAGANLGEIKAKLDDGVLTVTVPKDIKTSSSRKIDIE
jgi:HSP20 family protein